MGMSSLSDFVTGASFARGEDVHFWVIAQNSGGYPDFSRSNAMPSIYINDRFMPVSLPLVGKAGDYGNIEKVQQTPALGYLLNQTKMDDWESFSKAAFGVDGAIDIGSNADPHILGIAAVSAGTTEVLRNLGKPWKAPEGIDIVVDAFRRAISELRKSNGSAWSSLLELSDSREGSSIAHGLSSMDHHSTLHETTMSYLKHGTGKLGFSLIRSDPDYPWLRNLLAALEEHHVLTGGLTRLNRSFAPSSSAGQDLNATGVTAIGISQTVEAVGRLLDEAEYLDAENHLVGAQKILAGMKAALDQVEARVAKAEAYFAQAMEDDESESPTP